MAGWLIAAAAALASVPAPPACDALCERRAAEALLGRGDLTAPTIADERTRLAYD